MYLDVNDGINYSFSSPSEVMWDHEARLGRWDKDGLFRRRDMR